MLVKKLIKINMAKYNKADLKFKKLNKLIPINGKNIEIKTNNKADISRENSVSFFLFIDYI